MKKQQAQLRLIDKPDEHGRPHQIELQVLIGEENLQHIVDYYPSPIDEFFPEQLNWYLNEYLLHPYVKQQNRPDWVTRKIASLGKQMGEQLFADDYVLYVMLEKLETIGWDQVLITCESERPEFFTEPWELLVLPDSNRYLGTSCAGFLRCPPRGETSWQEEIIKSQSPFRILMVTSMAADSISSEQIRKTQELYYHLLESYPSLQVELLQATSWSYLKEKLAEEEFHLLHLGLSVKTEENHDYFLFEDGAGDTDLRSPEQLAQLLKESKISQVVLDSIADRETMALQGTQESLALKLLQQGIKNVITHSPCYSSSSLRFLQSFYGGIASGLSFATSLVETRKSMQLNNQQAVLSSQPLPLHDWVIIRHYGNEGIRLLFEGEENTSPEDRGNPAQLGKTLAGFNSQYLPPQEYYGRDREFKWTQKSIASGKSALLLGAVGIGKTHFLHQFAYWFVASKLGEAAFYFDFHPGNFETEEILAMLGHFFDGEKAEQTGTEERIRQQKLLLVLDHLPLEKTEQTKAILEFVDQHSQGATTFLIGSESCPEDVETKGLSRILFEGLAYSSQKQLAAKVLRDKELQKKETEEGYESLVESLNGHPASLVTLLPLLKDHQENQYQNYCNHLDLMQIYLFFLRKEALIHQ